MSGLRWQGQLLLAPGAAAYVGPVLPTRSHRHHAVQLLLAPEGIDLVCGEGPVRRVKAAILGSARAHALLSPTPRAAVVLVEPTSALGRRLPPVHDLLVLAAEPATLHARLEAPLDLAWIEASFGLWALPPPLPVRRHPAVSRVQRTIDERLSEGALDAASLAAVAGLSASRLGHAFREHVGLPVRAYVKWRRLERAARLLGAGRSVTDAAHGAGFADAAHLARTFRALLGLAPSDLAGHVTWITPGPDPRSA